MGTTGFRAITAAALLGVIGLTVLAPQSASAAATARHKPAASLSFAHDKITAGTGPEAIYATRHLPGGSVIALQRQLGTARAWRTVRRLHRASGKVRAPAVAMGKYRYRIRVTHGATAVATSPVRTLLSYGKIRYAILCTDWLITPCTPNTVQIGSTVYTYVNFEDFASYPSYNSVLKLNSTSCDHITMTYATSDTTSGDTAYLQVLQAKADPVNASTPEGTIGTLSAKLNRGAIIVNASDGNGFRIYVNGSAACYTASGRP